MKQYNKTIIVDGLEILQERLSYKANEGDLYNGIIKSNNKKVLIKKQKYSSDYLDEVLKILKGKKHSNIIEIIAFQNIKKGKIIVMELADGSVKDLMENNFVLNNETIIIDDVFIQMVQGVNEFHKYSLIHRDLKPENFVYFFNQENKKIIIKLIDFGTSKMENTIYTQNVGTINYIAPELVRNIPYDQSIDIWSLGIIYYEIITTEDFFNGNTIDEIKQQIQGIVQMQVDQKIKKNKQLNCEQKELLLNILKIQKNERINCLQIINKLSDKASIDEDNKWKQAMKDINLWIENQKNEEVQKRIAELLQDDKITQKAIQYFDKLIAVDPKNHKTYEMIADLLLSYDKCQEAIKYFDKWIAINPKNDITFESIVWLLLFHNKCQETIQYFDQWIAIDPKNDNTYEKIAQLLLFNNKCQEMIQYFDQWIAIDPKNDNTYERIAQLLLFHNKCQETIQYFEQLITIDPKNDNTYEKIAQLLLFHNKCLETIQYFDQWIAIDPKNDNTYEKIANLLLSKNKCQETIQYFHKWIAIDPNNDNTYERIAELLLKFRKNFESLELTVKSITYQPKYQQLILECILFQLYFQVFNSNIY